MSDAVLDASAVLAYLTKERGHQKVTQAIEHENAYLNSVNYCEVISSLVDHGMRLEMAVSVVRDMELILVVFDEHLAVETARLRAATKSLGLSLADRSCIALARHLRLPLYTTDKAWQSVKAGIKINLIR